MIQGWNLVSFPGARDFDEISRGDSRRVLALRAPVNR